MELQVTRVRMVSMEPLDQLDLRERLAHLVRRSLVLTNPDLLAPLVPLVKMELQVSLVVQDPLVLSVPLDQLDLLADQAQTDFLAALVLKVKLETQVSQEALAETDNLALQADNLVQLDLKDLRDHQDLMALLATMVSANQELRGKTDSPADLVSLVQIT